MNKKNVKYWIEGDQIFGEWADRALDDEDRDLPDTVKITVSRYTSDNPVWDQLLIESDLLKEYDQWVEDTR